MNVADKWYHPNMMSNPVYTNHSICYTTALQLLAPQSTRGNVSLKRRDLNE